MGEPGLEQRVAKLEGRVEDFAGRFDALERRMDARFEAVDRRLEGVDACFEVLQDTLSTQFRWLVAGQVTVLVTVVGVLATALFAV